MESCSQKMLQLQSPLPPNAEEMRETRRATDGPALPTYNIHVHRIDCSMCQINKTKSKSNHCQYARQIKQACSVCGYSVADCSAVFYHTLIQIKTIAKQKADYFVLYLLYNRG